MSGSAERTRGSTDLQFLHPPGARDHEVSATVTVPRKADTYSLMPHMHFRGKCMKFTALCPDGSEELILSVPDYSFNWQYVSD